MLRAVIVSPNPEMISKLQEATEYLGRIAIIKTSDRYMFGHELERFLRANAPQVVFLDIEQLGDAIAMVEEIEEVMPGVQVAALDRALDPSVLLNLMHRGVREFLPFPFDANHLLGAVSRLEELLEKNPARYEATDMVLSFLPAKAGVGTSTVALNTAVALSRMADTNVLLSDLDLNSGMIGFMLKLDNAYTIYEAAESSTKLDEHLWPQLVANIGNLDVLPAGRLDPQSRVDPAQLRHVITFARRFYKAICLDLSGNMEKYSLEVMQESKRIFLVSTPEIPALHLARQKFQLLSNMDLADRVTVILNRAHKRDIISTAQIEQLLGIPVFMEFPNDYQGVHDSLTNGTAVDAATDLGKQFLELGYQIMEKKPPVRKRRNKKKFLEYFTIPRYSLSAEK